MYVVLGSQSEVCARYGDFKCKINFVFKWLMCMCMYMYVCVCMVCMCVPEFSTCLQVKA